LRRGRSALLIAGTGQGKTLAAWRPIAEALLDASMGHGPRSGFRGVQVHVAPLKALARDMLVNLDPLLAGDGTAPRHDGTLHGPALRRQLCRRAAASTALAARSAQHHPGIAVRVCWGPAADGGSCARSATIVIDEVHALATDAAWLAPCHSRWNAWTHWSAGRFNGSVSRRPPSRLDELAAWLGGGSGDVIAPDGSL
jgi:ATP-dependent Lhr-like helicase